MMLMVMAMMMTVMMMIFSVSPCLAHFANPLSALTLGSDRSHFNCLMMMITAKNMMMGTDGDGSDGGDDNGDHDDD